MTTAVQAKQATMEKINQIAKAFITNCAEPAIDEATKLGNFSTSVDFKDVINPAQTGEAVVAMLTAHGYEAKHVYYDGPNGYDNYIFIRWEDAQ